MQRKNLNTSLRRRSRGATMADFDALPRDLRVWLADAALPWSARSVRRLWTETLAASNDSAAALAALRAAEARMLRRDAPRVWGKAHPACRQGEA